MRDSIQTVQDFFNVVVEPNVREAITNPHDQRLVLNALISLHQMNDWAFYEYVHDPNSTTGARAQLRKYSERLYERKAALGEARVYATNAKHCRPDSVDHKTFATSAMDATSVRLSVIAKSADGTSARMVETVLEAFEFWKRELEILPNK
ncbi:hypothetical protein [Paraburkholderia graminis]|uniref:hypothetical protein n=1 Tax=Paraburkholderia graminis TaxID=60548 RepID=UPI0038BC6625